MNDGLKISGRLDIFLNGEIVQTVDNLVVTAGKTFVAARMANAASAVMSHMAIGTGSTAAAAGDTTLVTENGRVALSAAGGTPSTNTVVYAATIPAGTGTGAITEAGVLNASSAGTLLCRTVFSVVNKAAGDSMTITWTLTVS